MSCVLESEKRQLSSPVFVNSTNIQVAVVTESSIHGGSAVSLSIRCLGSEPGNARGSAPGGSAPALSTGGLFFYNYIFLLLEDRIDNSALPLSNWHQSYP
ncbi:unnamed protein product (mitochondrion) [Musa textilis]